MNVDVALASGLPVGIGQRVHCDVCSKELAPNDHVEVLVLFDGANVDVVTTRGRCCARGELADATQRPCWLVRGQLAASIDARGGSEVIVSGTELVDRTE